MAGHGDCITLQWSRRGYHPGTPVRSEGTNRFNDSTEGIAMLPTIIHRAPTRRRGDFDFDRLFNGLLDLDRSSRTVAAADLYETEEGYGLELELPGFNEAEIDITVDRGVLTISGARAEEEEEKGRTYHVRERRNEPFTRSFSLPASIRGESVAAHLNAGVLTVELPKSPEAKPHRVTVGGAK